MSNKGKIIIAIAIVVITSTILYFKSDYYSFRKEYREFNPYQAKSVVNLLPHINKENMRTLDTKGNIDLIGLDYLTNEKKLTLCMGYGKSKSSISRPLSAYDIEIVTEKNTYGDDNTFFLSDGYLHDMQIRVIHNLTIEDTSAIKMIFYPLSIENGLEAVRLDPISIIVTLDDK